MWSHLCRFDKSTEKTVYHSLVVVGAGFSGLYAARLLRKQFPDLLVVEADDRIGGRVKPLEGLVSWPVQEGPECAPVGLSPACIAAVEDPCVM